ncbi:unnamed protein product [Didymodactylos carnosus]|uniref:HAT C-terminal dimerisation domain-containing protein n=1 Tax=Didymodactylos carnosus TaxID=1234261 RepID=A0A815FFH2_9BILA|nr:unnamed protein product [Didymodactylos carnosus]CAF1325917.1 unnamed protein product [Didymodactylos carnosus]CAF3941927.1 unnamed protein product [Didymodactylos carnosus]CAF4175572.1 unnamed protein product [Didymodactylos carnosus]
MNMVRKLGIDSVVRSSEPNTAVISAASPCPVTSSITSTPSPSVKRRFPVESPSVRNDDRSIKRMREELIEKHSVCPKVTADALTTEIENYLNLDIVCDDVLRFWRISTDRFSHLSALARIILAVPSTSTPSEQVFSTTGLIVNSKRTTLAPENIGKIQLIHDNYDLFKG